MKFYPEQVNVNHDKGYFTENIYDKYAHCESQDIFRCQVEMIQDVIGPFAGKKTLDIGGALGWFAKRCIDKGADAYCQDISEWACANSPITDRMKCGDIGSGILFEDSSFDIVTAIESLEHVLHVQFALSEIARVLKPGGLSYCSVGTSEALGHIHIGTILEWEKLVNDTPGLSVEPELTKKMREHPFCILQNWKAIIAVKS